MEEWDTSVTLTYYAFCLKSEDNVVLIDTGLANAEWVWEHRKLRLLQEVSIEAALGEIDVNPSDVKTVILTHLHWDHCSNNTLFKNAQFIVQEKEMIHALSPIPTQRAIYGWDDETTPPFLQMVHQYKMIHGDRHICDGVEVVLIPSHTPGIQGVLVQGRNKRYLLAGDALPLYDNFEQRFIPSGLHVSLEDYYRTYEKIQALEVDEILPGHDERLMSRLMSKTSYT
jgi:glyoxylase-like metal-dependent hydrolase (beta-lactamase superfamily II)